MDDPVIRPIPPNSTTLRELAHAIADALTLPATATKRDELTYLRISRDRNRLVLYAMRRILADRETGDQEIMAAVTNLREQSAQLPDDSCSYRPEPS